jgi:hypothetical protein
MSDGNRLTTIKTRIKAILNSKADGYIEADEWLMSDVHECEQLDVNQCLSMAVMAVD